MKLVPLTTVLSLAEDGPCRILALDEDGFFSAWEGATAAVPHLGLKLKWNSICLDEPLLNAKFSDLVESCYRLAGGSPGNLPAPLQISTSGSNHLYVDALPVPQSLRTKLEGAWVLLYFREVRTLPDHCENLLQRQFHLTPAEAGLARIIGSGESLKAAAERLGISIWTARSHLRAVFQKTDTHRQNQLAALVAQVEHMTIPHLRDAEDSAV